MKIPRILFGAGFALALSLTAQAASSAQAWLENYYQNPQPSELPQAVYSLSREGYFQQPAHASTAIGFLATVFAQNPDKVDGWLFHLEGLPPADRRVIACALWQAGNPRGEKMLRDLASYGPNPAEIARLASTRSTPVADAKVLTASSMNLQWGAFLASGDQKYVVNVLTAIGTDGPALDEAARYQLAMNAAAHPRVMEICRAELSRQPDRVQKVLTAALNDASAASANRPQS